MMFVIEVINCKNAILMITFNMTIIGSTRTSQYELMEYVNDVNRAYVQVLAEQNGGGRTDTVYTYGAGRTSSEKWNQEERTGYYLYDPRGSVAGITDGAGHLTETYRYSASGEMLYGAPQYENVYGYNGESYNPNIKSQYLRARYYNVATAAFLTRDSYLGETGRPLTLNRYGYCLGNPVCYVDPSGHWIYEEELEQLQAGHERMRQEALASGKTQDIPQLSEMTAFLSALHELESANATVEYALQYNYRGLLSREYVWVVEQMAEQRNQGYACEVIMNYLERDWLTMYTRPTVLGEGRHVPRNENANKYDWAAPENSKDINAYARKQIENNGGEVIINAHNADKGNIFTDDEGRYWVAVGPRVINPNIDLSRKLNASDVVYGTKIDIHVQDKEGNEYYIPAVVGDIKQHSGPDGLYQTGISIPDGKCLNGYADGSTIEFIGNGILRDQNNKYVINITNAYLLIEVIVYDGIVNY